VTYPITPNPAIHNIPPAIAKQTATLTTEALQAMGQQMVQAIVNAILYIITGGLLGSAGNTQVTPSQAAPDYLQTLFGNLSALWGQTMSELTTDVVDIETALTNWWNNTIVPLGLVFDAALTTYISDLTAELQKSSVNFQTLVNGVVGLVDSDVSALTAALNTIGGNASSAFTAWDIFFTDIGFSVTDASTFATWLTSVANSGPWPGITSAEALSNRAIYKPSYLAIDASADAVFPTSQLIDSTRVVTVTPDTALIGYIGTPDAGLKQSIIWQAPTVGGGLALFLSVYSVNTITGALTRMFTIGPINAVAAGWNYTSIPTISQFVSVQGAWYAVELMMEAVAGSSFNIAGHPGHAVPVNTIATTFPQSMGGSRTSLNQAAFDVADSPGVRTTNTGTTLNFTESFTAPNGDDVLLSVAAYSNGTAITSITATYGGTTMIVQTSVSPNATASNGLLYIFKLVGGGSGSAKTVSVTVNNSASATTWIALRATSYNNCTSGLSTAAFSGSGTALAASATGIPEGLNVVAFMSIGSLSSASIGTPTGATQRAVWNSGGNNFPSIMVCDSITQGSFNVTATAGASNPWCAITSRFAGTPALAPSTVAAPGPPYSGNIPWFALGGSLGVPQHPPVSTTLTAASGTYTLPIWMALGDLIDIVILSDGGGGDPGNTIFSYGGGGNGGHWSGVSLIYGVDVPLTTTSFTFVLGQGGAGGIVEITNGAAGAGCTVTIAGYSGSPITVAGGVGGTGDPAYFGETPGNFTFSSGLGDTTYVGGGVQLVASAPGFAPGGGGAGGSYLASGANGAAARLWITAYQ
jgi:hypothetical protein